MKRKKVIYLNESYRHKASVADSVIVTLPINKFAKIIICGKISFKLFKLFCLTKSVQD